MTEPQSQQPPPLPPPPPPRWFGFASGVVAGATGVLVGHAFDTMKVQAQIDGGPALASSSQGPLLQLIALYRGILPPLLTTGAIRSLYFGVFENVKLGLGAPTIGDASMGTTLCAAGFTGLSLAPVTQPFVCLKVWQQAHGGSLVAAASKLSRSRGFRGYFPGFGLHCGLETVGSIVYLGVYYQVKRMLRAEDGTESLRMRVMAGAMAGSIAWSTIYPLDVLRSRLMAGSMAGSTSIRATAQQVYTSGGLAAFYRGIGATLMRAGPVAGVLLPVNDLIHDELVRRAGLRCTQSGSDGG
jgi:solute carrier family 25 (mitochondrial carnitine/acylcarnitine transporter), member 20/29